MAPKSKAKSKVLYVVKVSHNGRFYREVKTVAVSEAQAENFVRHNLVGDKDWSEWSFKAHSLKSASRQLELPGIDSSKNAQLL